MGRKGKDKALRVIAFFPKPLASFTLLFEGNPCVEQEAIALRFPGGQGQNETKGRGPRKLRGLYGDGQRAAGGERA